MQEPLIDDKGKRHSSNSKLKSYKRKSSRGLTPAVKKVTLLNDSPEPDDQSWTISEVNLDQYEPLEDLNREANLRSNTQIGLINVDEASEDESLQEAPRWFKLFTKSHGAQTKLVQDKLDHILRNQESQATKLENLAHKVKNLKKLIGGPKK